MCRAAVRIVAASSASKTMGCTGGGASEWMTESRRAGLSRLRTPRAPLFCLVMRQRAALVFPANIRLAKERASCFLAGAGLYLERAERPGWPRPR